MNPGGRGTPPGRSGACCGEASGEQAKEGGVRRGRGEVDADAGGLLDDAGAATRGMATSRVSISQ